MRVNSIANIYETYALQQTNSRVRQSDAINGSESKRDSIEVSSSARSFTTALQAIANAPEIREDIVSDIRVRVENGAYTPDALRIIEKLLANQ